MAWRTRLSIFMTDNTPHNDPTGMTLLFDTLFTGWQNTLGNIKHSYANTADSLTDEILITLSEEQLNQALTQYVVDNVGLLLKLKINLNDGYFTLSCTTNFLGLYLSVASNFQLVQVRLDRHVQRLTFKQISDTLIQDLHADSWWKAPTINTAINLYRKLLKKDPLPFLLSLAPKLKGLPFIEYKGNVIYLEIGRWLPNHIKTHLKKVQVNTAYVQEEQLILHLQPNFGDILSLGDPDANIITEQDNPNKPKTQE